MLDEQDALDVIFALSGDEENVREERKMRKRRLRRKNRLEKVKENNSESTKYHLFSIPSHIYKEMREARNKEKTNYGPGPEIILKVLPFLWVCYCFKARVTNHERVKRALTPSRIITFYRKF